MLTQAISMHFILLFCLHIAFADVLTGTLLDSQDLLVESSTDCCKDVPPNPKEPAQNAPYYCNNRLLGPQILPWRFPLLSLVSDYDRFGGLTPMAFLKEYRKRDNSDWKYPQSDGFQLDIDGLPISGNMTLPKGYLVDRFGSEYGRYVAAADGPYAQRSLSPEYLIGCEPNDKACKTPDVPLQYNVYEVVRDFSVIGGPVAPWFGQPGGGIQFFLDRSIVDILEDPKNPNKTNVHLKKLDLSKIRPGPGVSTECEKRPSNCGCEAPK